jgi:glycosyltransferase involved in cell wall biosynthesis
LLYYLANILWDSNDITDRIPLDFKAATYRVKHIIDSYNRNVIVVSEGEGKKRGKYEYVEKKVTDNIKIHYLKYVNRKFFKRIISVGIVTKYLFAHVKSGDTILVYNAAPVQSISLFLFRLSFRKVRVIIEFEEFHRVENNIIRNSLMAIGEIIGILEANDFIISNKNMSKKINSIKLLKKPNFLLSFGYKNNDINRKTEISKCFDECTKPNIIYSGRMDYVGGIDIFIEALNHLEIDCNIYITGKCDENLVGKIKNNQIANNIHLVGFLSETDYYKLLAKKCVCINPIRAHATFAKFSFPSKVLQYLQTGNLVVSSRISALDNLGELNNYILRYDNDSPRQLAGQITKACDEINSINKKEIIVATSKFIQNDQMNINNFLNVTEGG